MGFRGRVHLIGVAVGLVLWVVGAASATADESPFAGGGDYSLLPPTFDLPGRDAPPLESASEAPAMSARARQTLRDAADAETESEQESRRFLTSSEGAAQRTGSRAAFDDFSDVQAVELLGRKFSADLRPQMPDAESLLSGGRVAEYRGDNVAVLAATKDQPAQLVESQAPLLVDDPTTPDTKKRPTDFDLRGPQPNYW